MTLATEISILETEVEQLKHQSEAQHQHINVLEFENEQLRRSLAKVQNERDMMMRDGENLKVLLDQTGALIVSGMQKYHSSRRELREQVPDGEVPPKFISDATRSLRAAV